jgi:hypothetical protein
MKTNLHHKPNLVLGCLDIGNPEVQPKKQVLPYHMVVALIVVVGVPL